MLLANELTVQIPCHMFIGNSNKHSFTSFSPVKLILIIINSRPWVTKPLNWKENLSHSKLYPTKTITKDTNVSIPAVQVFKKNVLEYLVPQGRPHSISPQIEEVSILHFVISLVTLTISCFLIYSVHVLYILMSKFIIFEVCLVSRLMNNLSNICWKGLSSQYCHCAFSINFWLVLNATVDIVRYSGEIRQE